MKTAVRLVEQLSSLAQARRQLLGVAATYSGERCLFDPETLLRSNYLFDKQRLS